jgi:hypothetical protein
MEAHECSACLCVQFTLPSTFCLLWLFVSSIEVNVWNFRFNSFCYIVHVSFDLELISYFLGFVFLILLGIHFFEKSLSFLEFFSGLDLFKPAKLWIFGQIVCFAFYRWYCQQRVCQTFFPNHVFSMNHEVHSPPVLSCINGFYFKEVYLFLPLYFYCVLSMYLPMFTNV